MCADDESDNKPDNTADFKERWARAEEKARRAAKYEAAALALRFTRGGARLKGWLEDVGIF